MSKRIDGQMSDRHVHARLNLAEYEAWGELVKKLGTTRSRLMRQLMREAVGQGPEALAGDFDEINEAARQVAAVGRNLNRIVRLLNMGKVINSERLTNPLETAIAATERVHQELNRAVDRSRYRWVRCDQR